MTLPGAPGEPVPIRLTPGADLRRALMELVRQRGAGPAFVLAGIGSLNDARLRFADASSETLIAGPFEIISVSGSVSADGAHLHMSVSDADGRVTGGHVCFGNLVRTTVEAVLMFLPAWDLRREPDPVTGYDELVIRCPGSGATPNPTSSTSDE